MLLHLDVLVGGGGSSLSGSNVRSAGWAVVLATALEPLYEKRFERKSRGLETFTYRLRRSLIFKHCFT